MSLDRADVLIILGVVGLIVGVGLVYVPAALIVAGALLVFLGVMRSRG